MRNPWHAVGGLRLLALVGALTACGDGTATTSDADDDTQVAADTLGPTDTTPADTHAPTDTRVADTAAPDTVTQDTAVADTDADTAVVDTVDAGTGADAVDADTFAVDTVTSDVVAPSCEAMTLVGPLDPVSGATLYELVGDLGLGSPALPDALSLEFYAPDTGIFDLGAGGATNYATCEQCVVIYADYDETTGASAATYFQRGGSLALAYPPGSPDFAALLTDLRVAEVTLDPVAYTSTPVPGGACYEAAGGTTLAVDPSAFACTELTLPSDLDALETAPISYGAAADLGLGGELDDLVRVELRTGATGAFALGTGVNADYQTCEQCLTVYEDFDGTHAAAIYFPSAGTLTVDPASTPGGPNVGVALAGVTLRQVILTEAGTAPAPNAGCLTVVDGTLTAGTLIDPSCVTFAVSGDLVRQPPSAYEITGDFGVGGAGADTLALEFYATATGSFDLGEGPNASYHTCNQCALLFADGDADSAAAVYFARGGTIAIDPATPPGGAALDVTLEQVSFEEVEIDPATYVSTPVEGGGCYALPGETPLATAPIQCTASCADRVCGPDGCGDVCGGCGASTCHLDGSKCEATPTCLQVTVGGDALMFLSSGLFGVDLTAAGAGAADLGDLLQIEFYASGTGSFDLAAGDNANYATCHQCVRAFVDDDTDGARQFFQSAGTMVVDPSTNIGAGPAKIGFTGLRLVEVTIQGGTYVSTPVEGGACIDILVTSNLTTPPP